MWLLLSKPGNQHTIVIIKSCLFVFGDKVSLYIPGCPGTRSVDHAGLELAYPPAFASQVLGLKAWSTITKCYH